MKVISTWDLHWYNGFDLQLVLNENQTGPILKIAEIDMGPPLVYSI